MRAPNALADALAREGRHVRLVRRARLTLTDRERAHAMRNALEDALNTADFNDAGRLVIVRSLRVRAVPAGASAHLLARSIEAAWRGVARYAVAAHAPGASEAASVWFASSFAARVLWLSRIATRQTIDAWFWPRALPELAMGSCLEERVAAVVQAAYDIAPVVFARTINAWSMRDRARLIDALPNEAPSFIALSKSWADEAPANQAQRVTPSRDETRAFASFKPWRVQWLADLGIHVDGLDDDDGERIETSKPRVQAATLSTATNTPRATDTEPSPEAPVLRFASDLPRHALGIHAAHDADAAIAADAHAPNNAAPLAPATIALAPWWNDVRFTTHGGWLMLLRVLDALGFGDWVDTQPRDQREYVVAHVLKALADAARMPAHDPQRALCTVAQTPTTDAARRWTIRLRRFLRRSFQLSLHALVARDGYVAITDTHVDVVFTLDQVDVHLRRCNLDADPHWVPWFGRIVAFHYLPVEDVRAGGGHA
ncbi:MAG TPA: hypothetical protein VFS42_03965 [Burkholderiaceae bacterium]|nr:hypothetical protein [Burkholderiaceae bacterium]